MTSSSFDDDSDWDDDYGPDQDDDEVVSVDECPMCGCTLIEDAPKCPLCGEWIVRPHTVWRNRPVWWSTLGILGILAVILSCLFLWF